MQLFNITILYNDITGGYDIVTSYASSQITILTLQGTIGVHVHMWMNKSKLMQVCREVIEVLVNSSDLHLSASPSTGVTKTLGLCEIMNKRIYSLCSSGLKTICKVSKAVQINNVTSTREC